MDYETTPEKDYASFPPHPKAQHEQRPKVKHSGPGIASFVISLVALVGYLVCLSLSFAAFGQIGSEEIDAERLLKQQTFIAGVYGLFVCGLLNVAAIITAIVGLALKNRKKIFAILGLIFGLLPFLLLIGLMIIGLVASGGSLSP